MKTLSEYFCCRISPPRKAGLSGFGRHVLFSGRNISIKGSLHSKRVKLLNRIDSKQWIHIIIILVKSVQNGLLRRRASLSPIQMSDNSQLLQQRWLLACEITEIYEFWEDGFVNKRKFPRFLSCFTPEGAAYQWKFYTEEAPPRGPTSHDFVYHFWQERYLFVYTVHWKMVPL